MRLFTFFFSLIISTCVFGQEFQEATESYARKKITYLTNDKGETSEVYVKKLKFKKGLVKEVKFEGSDGKKVKVKPEAISYMYVPIDWSEKIWNAPRNLVENEQWGEGEIDQRLIGEGYAYFEKAEVFYKKKKKQTLMMQVLNPSFSSKVKIYDDPLAKETAGIGIGALKVGKNAKSFFLSIGGDTAIKIEKKKYPDQIIELLNDCEDIKSLEFPWRDLAKVIYHYDRACK